ncbi:hypothetical protein CEXT_537441 [Caerostris extrusa]|uniref:Uncharacterized protein n=1 Tax=Caerostris extrusa TaxID=172846 RepID=A0AAV4XI77_CAEEX|nr:hypothetical protein CEXT_537441 [Caerostris extrusa]
MNLNVGNEDEFRGEEAEKFMNHSSRRMVNRKNDLFFIRESFMLGENGHSFRKMLLPLKDGRRYHLKAGITFFITILFLSYFSVGNCLTSEKYFWYWDDFELPSSLVKRSVLEILTFFSRNDYI